MRKYGKWYGVALLFVGLGIGGGLLVMRGGVRAEEGKTPQVPYYQRLADTAKSPFSTQTDAARLAPSSETPSSTTGEVASTDTVSPAPNSVSTATVSPTTVPTATVAGSSVRQVSAVLPVEATPATVLPVEATSLADTSNAESRSVGMVPVTPPSLETVSSNASETTDASMEAGTVSLTNKESASRFHTEVVPSSDPNAPQIVRATSVSNEPVLEPEQVTTASFIHATGDSSGVRPVSATMPISDFGSATNPTGISPTESSADVATLETSENIANNPSASDAMAWNLPHDASVRATSADVSQTPPSPAPGIAPIETESAPLPGTPATPGTPVTPEMTATPAATEVPPAPASSPIPASPASGESVPETPAQPIPETPNPVPAPTMDGTSEATSADKMAPKSLPTPPAGEIVRSHSPSPNAGTDRQILSSQQSPSILIETVGTSSVALGRESTYEVVVRNPSNVGIQSLLVSVEIPSELETISVTPDIGTVQNESGKWNWTLEKLDPFGRATLTVVGIPRVAQPFDLAVHATIPTLNDRTTFEVLEPKLSLAIQGPPRLLADRSEVFRLVLQNSGTGDADNVNIVLTTLASGQDKEITIPHPIGTIPPGEPQQLDVRLTARRAGQLQVKVIAQNESLGQLAETATSVEVCKPEIAVSLEGPGLQYVGGCVNYRFAVRNRGNATAENVVLTSELPENARWITEQPDVTITNRGHLLTWTLPNLEPNDERTCVIGVESLTPGPCVAEVKAVAAGNLSTTAQLPSVIEAVATLSLNVDEPTRPVFIENQAEYTLTIRNGGSAEAKDVEVTGEFGDGVLPESADGAKFSLQGNKIRFDTIPTIAPNQTVTLKVNTRAKTSGNRLWKFDVYSASDGLQVARQGTTRFYGDSNTAMVPRNRVTQAAARETVPPSGQSVTPNEIPIPVQSTTQPPVPIATESFGQETQETPSSQAAPVSENGAGVPPLPTSSIPSVSTVPSTSAPGFSASSNLPVLPALTGPMSGGKVNHGTSGSVANGNASNSPKSETMNRPEQRATVGGVSPQIQGSVAPVETPLATPSASTSVVSGNGERSNRPVMQREMPPLPPLKEAAVPSRTSQPQQPSQQSQPQQPPTPEYKFYG